MSSEFPGEALTEQPQIIAIDPAIVFGRPIIAGSRVPTAEVAERYLAGDSVSNLVEEYGRSSEEIEEAIRCELIPAFKRLDALTQMQP